LQKLHKKASDYQTKLIVFPEMTLTSYSINVDLIAEDKYESITIKRFQELASNYEVAIFWYNFSKRW